MSNPRYFYTLTRDKILNTLNRSLKTMGVDSSRDQTEPMVSLFLDIARQVAINGKKRNEDKIIINNPIVDDNVSPVFIKWISQQFSKDNIENLKKHYSQGPMIRTGQAFTVDCAKKNGIFLTTPDMEKNLYEKNGIVYFKIKASNFKISKMPNPEEIIGEIKGPVEALYKLTDSGFEIQNISTDSKLLHDMFLGGIPSEAEIMYNSNANKLTHTDLNKIEYALEMHQEKLFELIPGTSASRATTKFTSALKTPHQDFKEIELHQLEISSIKSTLKAIKQYKEHKIDLEDLQTAVAAYKEQAETARSDPKKLTRFFSRNVKPTTTKILNDLQAKLKSIEISQKKQKSATLGK